MNLNQIINMVMRIIMRKVINAGINKGMSAATNQVKKRKAIPQDKPSDQG